MLRRLSPFSICCKINQIESTRKPWLCRCWRDKTTLEFVGFFFIARKIRTLHSKTWHSTQPRANSCIIKCYRKFPETRVASILFAKQNQPVHKHMCNHLSGSQRSVFLLPMTTKGWQLFGYRRHYLVPLWLLAGFWWSQHNNLDAYKLLICLTFWKWKFIFMLKWVIFKAFDKYPYNLYNMCCSIVLLSTGRYGLKIETTKLHVSSENDIIVKMITITLTNIRV